MKDLRLASVEYAHQMLIFARSMRTLVVPRVTELAMTIAFPIFASILNVKFAMNYA